MTSNLTPVDKPVVTPTPGPSPASASTTNSVPAPSSPSATPLLVYKVGNGEKGIQAERSTAICPAGSSNNQLDNPYIASLVKKDFGGLVEQGSECWDKTKDYPTLWKNHDTPMGNVKPISCKDGGALETRVGGISFYSCIKCPPGTTHINPNGLCLA